MTIRQILKSIEKNDYQLDHLSKKDMAKLRAFIIESRWKEIKKNESR